MFCNINLNVDKNSKIYFRIKKEIYGLWMNRMFLIWKITPKQFIGWWKWTKHKRIFPSSFSSFFSFGLLFGLCVYMCWKIKRKLRKKGSLNLIWWNNFHNTTNQHFPPAYFSKCFTHFMTFQHHTFFVFFRRKTTNFKHIFFLLFLFSIAS